jgi:hypothetical protein
MVLLKTLRMTNLVKCIGLILALNVLPLTARSTELWLSGLAPSMLAAMRPGTKSDFLELFQPDAPWAHAASAVTVFKIYSQFVSAGSDEELRQAFRDLRRRNIALALEAGLMTAIGTCARGEGYAAPGAVSSMVKRIHSLGGDLRYIAMDEPLWFGHQLNGPASCRTPIRDLVRDVVTNVQAAKQVFPAVQVGDIEPFGGAEPAGWIDEIMQWSRAYQEAAGEPLAFFDVDIIWGGPWQRQLELFVPRLSAGGLKFGIIYNGDPSDQTGTAWTRRAEQRFAAIEANPALTPDQAILQSWMPHPAHMLPETEAGTMTWLVNRYLAAEARLVLHRAGDQLEGRLTDVTGKPLAGAKVDIAAEQTGEALAPPVHSRSGEVPANAVTALFGLRVNAECGCSGPANISIGQMRYHDDTTGQTVQRAFHQASAPGKTALADFHALTGQTILQNTSAFPVNPGDPFTFRIPMVTDPSSAGSGYVSLDFLDAKGKEVERQKLLFEPAERSIGAVTTGADGRFSLEPSSDVLHSSVGFRAEFIGDSQHRIASATSR